MVSATQNRETYGYLMVYTADLVSRAEHRRASVAIEPRTCPPDALRSRVDLSELAPGAAWRGTCGLRTPPRDPGTDDRNTTTS